MRMGDKEMKFIREIPTAMIQNKHLALEQEGFTLVWKEDSVEVWVEMTDLEKAA